MMAKMMKGLFYLVAALMVAWVLVSWGDIVADNNNPNPVHSEYNFFEVAF